MVPENIETTYLKPGEARLNIEKPLQTSRGALRLAILYLLAITGAEVVTNFYNSLGGVIANIILLTALIVHSSLITDSPNHKLLLSLSLAPLTRIMSLTMPLVQFPPIYWYLIIYPPLLLACLVTMYRLRFSAREVGVTIQKLPVQLGVMVGGFVFGIVEYLILRPEPLVATLYWKEMLLPIFVLMAGTGLVEEFMFRGVMQRAALEALGKWGLPYVALIFAILHLIHNSAVDIVFVFVVGLFFGWIVKKTGSLFGVTLSHGITNCTLYLIAPFFAEYLKIPFVS